jgi:hypothetical protein
MKKIQLLTATATLCLFWTACAEQVKEAPQMELKTFKEKNSYVGGTDIGNSLKAREKDIDLQALLRGLEDAFTGKDLLVAPDLNRTKPGGMLTLRKTRTSQGS